ncbi:MAG: class I SAM-dependent methyltransferase [Burkholderiales bacterium]|nr:class I SAM-dependent methyltransferase [Burkholderiales bacterium]
MNSAGALKPSSASADLRRRLHAQISFERLSRCPVCESERWSLAFSKEDEFLGMRFDIQRCASCTALFVNPRIARRHLEALYGDSYFQGESWDSDTDYLSNYERPARLAALAAMYVRYYRQMRERIGLTAPRILDAGAGLGLFAQAVKERHPEADIVSLDPAAFAVEHMRSLGLEAVRAELEDYRSERPFDGVFMREVLEHLYEPRVALRRIVSQMKPGGLLFYTTGNTDAVKDLASWGYVRPIGHIVYYNYRSAERLLRDCGLKPYPRELLRVGRWQKMRGAVKWISTRLRRRRRQLPLGIRIPPAA